MEATDFAVALHRRQDQHPACSVLSLAANVHLASFDNLAVSPDRTSRRIVGALTQNGTKIKHWSIYRIVSLG